MAIDVKFRVLMDLDLDTASASIPVALLARPAMAIDVKFRVLRDLDLDTSTRGLSRTARAISTTRLRRGHDDRYSTEE